MKVDPKLREMQIERLKRIYSERDSTAVKQSLDALKKVAQGNDNLMPIILDAVRKRASLGEICDVLRGVFGEYLHASHC